MGTGKLEIVGYSMKLANSYDRAKRQYLNFDKYPRLVPVSFRVPPGSAEDIQPLVRLSDVAVLAAEVEKLQKALEEIVGLPVKYPSHADGDYETPFSEAIEIASIAVRV